MKLDHSTLVTSGCKKIITGTWRTDSGKVTSQTVKSIDRKTGKTMMTNVSGGKLLPEPSGFGARIPRSGNRQLGDRRQCNRGAGGRHGGNRDGRGEPAIGPRQFPHGAAAVRATIQHMPLPGAYHAVE